MAITKRDLAIALELDESMISRLCTGQRLPSVASMHRITKLFGVKGDVLIRAHVKGPAEFSNVFNALIEGYNAATYPEFIPDDEPPAESDPDLEIESQSNN
jgi:transcriptional regulator with XRE-family HTH domain